MITVMSPTSPTQSLASFATTLTFEHIPTDVIDKLKLHMLDAVGAGLYGSRMPWTRTVAELLRDEGGRGQHTVWGRAFCLPMAGACFANSMATHAFELDDRRIASYVHPAATTVNVALALAEHDPSLAGVHLLAAITAGYEVSLRVGRCVGRLSFERGFYPPGLVASFGAATVAGKLLGFDNGAMARTFGVTATQACGLYSPTHLKRFNIGRGAHGGVIAALLTRKGFEAPDDTFEAEVGGLCKAIADDCDVSVLHEGLGEHFDTRNVELKPYVSSRPNHVAIDLMLQLRAERAGLREADIDSVMIEIGSHNYKYGAGFQVKSVSEALMSVAYCAAVALVDGEAFLDQFTAEKVTDPQVQRLLAKTLVRKNTEFDALGLEKRDMTRLEVTFVDGSRYEAENAFALGHPHRPMPTDAVVRKYRRLTANVLPERRAREIERRVLDFEHETELASLVRLLSAS